MSTGSETFAALGTTAQVVVTDRRRLSSAVAMLHALVTEVDLACSRFRLDSEITWLHASAGAACAVSPLLYAALDVAMSAAERTDGLVDPTVGDAVRRLGYDRDFADLVLDDPRAVPSGIPAPGWWRVQLDPATLRVVVPRGVSVDLGATAKAFAADRGASSIARATGCGVMVNLGGDLAVAGDPPVGGWRITVGDDHAATDPTHDPTVTVRSGGLATSSTTCRTWRRAGRTLHHIVDPRTGESPVPLWRTVSVAAVSCVDANAAATAAIVLGASAPDWLAERNLPARLVHEDGHVHPVAGWPAERRVAS